MNKLGQFKIETILKSNFFKFSILFVLSLAIVPIEFSIAANNNRPQRRQQNMQNRRPSQQNNRQKNHAASVKPHPRLRQAEFAKVHPRRAEVNGRINNQEKRINQGVKSGNLTSQQATQLKQEDASIKQQERADVKANGGYLTRGQQKQINGELNQESKQIYQDKHGGGNSVPSVPSVPSAPSAPSAPVVPAISN